LEALLADCENIPEKAIKEKICSQREIAILSKDLATIIRHVDVNFDITKATVTLPQIKKVSDFLRKMQFYTFIKNIDKILTSFNPEEVTEGENFSTSGIICPIISGSDPKICMEIGFSRSSNRIRDAVFLSL